MNSTSLSKPGLKPWQFFLTVSFLGAAAAVWLSPMTSPVGLIFMSLAIVAAGASASALHGVLTALAGKSAPESLVSATAREGLEREKLHVLRSLKDLEFDKAMGKVSAADAAPLELRLRERAMAIIRDLDSREDTRLRVERDLAARQGSGLRAQGSGLRTQDSGLRTQDSAPEPRAQSPEPVTCASCATTNDRDARFCKGCGSKL